MTREDFEQLKNFTAEEVEATGAKIKDVQFETMYKLQVLRDILGVSIHLIKKGITTGRHKAKEHKAGKAIDFHFSPGVEFPIMRVLAAVLLAGFTALGAYWNGVLGSYHVDLGLLRSWRGRKEKGDDQWTFGPLVLDPKQGWNA